MTHIPLSEDILMAEHHEQRHLALLTVENHDNGLELQRKYDIMNLGFDMIKKLRNQYLIGE